MVSSHRCCRVQLAVGAGSRGPSRNRDSIGGREAGKAGGRAAPAGRLAAA